MNWAKLTSHAKTNVGVMSFCSADVGNTFLTHMELKRTLKRYQTLNRRMALAGQQSGYLGVGKHCVLEVAQRLLRVELHTDEHDLRARRHSIGGPQ